MSRQSEMLSRNELQMRLSVDKKLLVKKERGKSVLPKLKQMLPKKKDYAKSKRLLTRLKELESLELRLLLNRKEKKNLNVNRPKPNVIKRSSRSLPLSRRSRTSSDKPKKLLRRKTRN
jgi:hypothetical protein